METWKIKKVTKMANKGNLEWDGLCQPCKKIGVCATGSEYCISDHTRSITCMRNCHLNTRIISICLVHPHFLSLCINNIIYKICHNINDT
jgi:hypothetical protein